MISLHSIRAMAIAMPILSLALIAPLSPQPVNAASLTFDTRFFNGAGAQIGSGEFTYDPERVVTALVLPPPASITFTNVLTSFLATLESDRWQISDPFGVWIDPQSGMLRQLNAPRGVQFPFIANQWGFGDVAIGTRVLFLQGQQIQPDQFRGTFIQAIVQNTPNGFTSGSWTATLRAEAVPEPSSLAGILVAVGLGAWRRSIRKPIRKP